MASVFNNHRLKVYYKVNKLAVIYSFICCYQLNVSANVMLSCQTNVFQPKQQLKSVLFTHFLFLKLSGCLGAFKTTTSDRKPI